MIISPEGRNSTADQQFDQQFDQHAQSARYVNSNLGVLKFSRVVMGGLLDNRDGKVLKGIKINYVVTTYMHCLKLIH